MKLISIYKDGVELDYIRDTLSLKVDTSLFPDTLRFESNEFPFLIINNAVTDKLFGLNDISVDSSPYYDVTIVTSEGSIPGELQILESFSDYRKCNVRFASKLFAESKKKIRELMPVISVTGTNPPMPYSDKYEGVPPAPTYYQDYVDSVRKGTFPNQLWTAAQISFPTKNGDYLKEDDKWYKYCRYLNGRTGEGNYYLNILEDTPEGGEVHNLNVPSWNVFLLTPLKIICDNIGLKFPENLLNNPFATSLAFYSSETNLTEVTSGSDKNNIQFDRWNWSFIANNTDPNKPSWKKEFNLNIKKAGKYSINYKFKALNNRYRIAIESFNGIEPLNPDEYFIEEKEFYNREEIFDNSFEFEVTQENINRDRRYFFVVRAFKPEDPFEIDHIYSNNILFKPGYMFHPTIEIGRYLPDWTVGDYLDQLRLLFNIQFRESENNTVLEVKYNDREISHIDYVDLGSIYIPSFPKNEITDLVLKFGNEIDPKLYINKESIADKRITVEDKTKLIENKFKYIPSMLTEASDKKDGIGLVLLTSNNDMPVSTIGTENFTMNSIYRHYYKHSMEAYLQSNRLQIEHSVTIFELNEIQLKRKVLINKRPYLVLELTKESTGDLVDVKLSLLPLK
ncbi:hypothetical protein HMPREF9714_03353 [Myroides odoratimimus CCUG 12901]|uniref:hypothetical protein n=1 Tax=Myroides odoratimimus TaxID=76832 RepID=UPI0002461159|nr:hypothetical protein [Myroides odoratimimus]EHO05415.1 hypothetical protein HMPREF9714_03353 [Myroides odoratimimus CCUG 12901]